MEMILNLVYPDKSDINYKLTKFPDGQQSVKIEPFFITPYKIRVDSMEYTLPSKDKIIIKTRLNNFSDLEVLICATQALRGLGWKEIGLYCPYFLGSRSDRKFEDGSVNYLKEVICPIINNLKFTSVIVLDPHSDILEACLNNFVKVSNKELVLFAIRDLYKSQGGHSVDKFTLMVPDSGASKKIYSLIKEIGYNGDSEPIICSKNRDKDGKLSKCIVPLSNFYSKDILLIDDIGDGFGTFINIAKELRDKDLEGRLYLVVTHSIQESGINKALDYFSTIYTTNSVNDWGSNNLKWNSNNIKTLNVF